MVDNLSKKVKNDFDHFKDQDDFNSEIYKNLIDNISTGIELGNSNAIIRKNSIYTDPNSQAVIIAGI